MTASPLAASDLPLKVLGGGWRRTGQSVLPRSRPSWQSRHHLAQSARLYIYISPCPGRTSASAADRAV